jgi:DNA polymerase III epsilon subunit-like protein
VEEEEVEEEEVEEEPKCICKIEINTCFVVFTTNMRILVFDTETTGLPKRYSGSLYDFENWPYVVQLSMLLYDLDLQRTIAIHDFIIKLPDGIHITEDSTNIHGITDEISKTKGVDIKDALLQMSICLDSAHQLVAHNIDFDRNMIAVECNRIGYPNILRIKPFIEYCTMQHSIELCNLKMISRRTNREMVKFPKLIELYQKLFNETPNNLHNSLTDVLVCFRCYHKLTQGNDVLNTDEEFRQQFIDITS